MLGVSSSDTQVMLLAPMAPKTSSDFSGQFNISRVLQPSTLDLKGHVSSMVDLFFTVRACRLRQT